MATLALTTPSVSSAEGLEPVKRRLILFVLVVLASLSFASFFQLRPNRIVVGEFYSLWTVGSGTLAQILWLGAAVSMGLSLFAPGAGRRWLLVFGSVSIFWALGAGSPPVAGSAVETLGPLARTSFGLAFWATALLAAWTLSMALKQSGLALRLFALVASAAAIVPLVVNEASQSFSLALELGNMGGRFWDEVVGHIRIVLISGSLALIFGYFIGYGAWKSGVLRGPLFSFLNGMQNVPSLALFGLLIAPLSALSRALPFLRDAGIRGVGDAPAIIALTLYALLPIALNTYIGLGYAYDSTLEAGRAMGMNEKRLFYSVRLPLALPSIVTGMRVSWVQLVGNAAVAAFIGGSGLGNIVFRGLGEASTDLIWLGALPIVLLAVAFDSGLRLLHRAAMPAHLKRL